MAWHVYQLKEGRMAAKLLSEHRFRLLACWSVYKNAKKFNKVWVEWRDD